MAKAGSVYEKLVADVVATMSPGTKVQYGQWTIGPDGRRDLDVEIRGQINREDQFIVIECKDWKTAVGIGVVDALDSKRRDINADYALICSNSGFTSEALQKGKRVGIGMVTILKSDDPIVKVVVEEEIYAKKIFIKEYKSTWHFADPHLASQMPKNLDPNEIKYKELPITNWVADKSLFLIEENANGIEVTGHYKLIKPTLFSFSTITLRVIAFDIHLFVETIWVSQVVSIDASKAIHDFILHRTIMPSGKNQQIKINGFDINKWKPISFVPVIKSLEANENRISFSLYENAITKTIGTDTPDMGALIIEETVTVDGQTIKQNAKPIINKQVKSPSGIEMLVTPIQGERIKLGRNESCYCGSGKKYKKCHGF